MVLDVKHTFLEREHVRGPRGADRANAWMPDDGGELALDRTAQDRRVTARARELAERVAFEVRVVEG